MSTSSLTAPASSFCTHISLVLPVPRRRLPQDDLVKPIPQLSDRQYVVEKTKKTPAQISAAREAFWYRESLLSSLTASWIEPGSRRSGSMSLRDQIVSGMSLSALRTDDLEVDLEAVPLEGPVIRATDFVNVKVKMTNRLGECLWSGQSRKNTDVRPPRQALYRY